MPQLIQMRQRIKAVETIEKITHAMQLISMSSHVRMRERKARVEEYHQTIQQLFHLIRRHVIKWDNALFYSTNNTNNPLFIIIGAQKGLCGTFNTNLMSRFEKDMQHKQFDHASLITVGKRTTDYIKPKLATFPIKLDLVQSYNDVTSHTISSIVTGLFNSIINTRTPYSHVIVYSNYPASFFMQKQNVTQLIPLALKNAPIQSFDETQEFIWEDDPQNILDALAHQYLQASLQSIIIQSLLAEHAARFVSMDNATRNAQSLRDTMRLQYNKLRQAKITKELTELSGSFQKNLSS